MRYTENINLRLPDDSDWFDISDMNDNMEKLDTVLGGLSFKNLTQDEYNNLDSYGSNTVYYVTDESGKVTQYLGSVKLSSGSSAGNAAASANGIMGLSGNAQQIEESE